MRRAFLLAALAAVPSSARAAAGAAVLRRPLSARAAALGEAFAAVGGGAASLGVNPAGAAAARRPELESTFTSGVLDDAFGFVGFSSPMRGGVASAGAAYYDAGPIDVVDLSGSSSRRSAERDYVGMLGWAMPLGAGVSAGALAKAYSLSLAQEAFAAGFAADAGLLWETGLPGVALGAAAQNLGPSVKFEDASDPLPATLRAGAAWTIDFRPARAAETYYTGTRVTLSADGIRVRDERAALAAAGEFSLDVGASTSVALRLGWVFNQDAGGLTFGAGLREGRFAADYSLAAKRDLGNVHTVSLGVRF